MCVNYLIRILTLRVAMESWNSMRADRYQVQVAAAAIAATENDLEERQIEKIMSNPQTLQRKSKRHLEPQQSSHIYSLWPTKTSSIDILP